MRVNIYLSFFGSVRILSGFFLAGMVSYSAIARKTMANETLGYVPKEVKKGVLYVAEKSAWVTIPATVIFMASGAVSVPLGAALIGGDVLTSHWAGQERRKLK